MTTHSHWCLVAVAREWSLFEQVERESLEKLADLPPPSAFDEMITWTKQGILWKFPVDNEQGTTASKLQSPTSHKGSMFITKNYLSGRTSSTNNVYLQIQTETNLSHQKIALIINTTIIAAPCVLLCWGCIIRNGTTRK